MKNSIIAVLVCFFTVLLLSSCSKDPKETEMDELEIVETTQKLSTIKSDGVELNRFYYEEDKLIEMQSDWYSYNEAIDSSELNTAHYYFEYENDKLSKVVDEFKEINLKYVDEDVIIDFVYQDREGTLTYKNYKDFENFEVELFYSDELNVNFSTEFDGNQNFLFATADNGNDIYEEYPGYYYLSQYYGTYEYLETNNHYKGFDLEVMLYLTQKPFNNSVRTIDRGYKRIEYEYTFDENQYPITSKAMTIYPNNPIDPDTLFHGLKEYTYE